MKSLLALIIWGMSAAAALAGQWEYGSWRVYTYVEDVGEDILTYCSAHSGGDGAPNITIEFMSHDGGPPYIYPSVVIEEYAPRGYDTQMQDGMKGYIIFDTYENAEALPFTGYDPDGFKYARVSYDHPYSQWVLQRMRHTGRMDLVVKGRPVAAFQLNGFTAAYLKAAEECGFTGVGVVN